MRNKILGREAQNRSQIRRYVLTATILLLVTVVVQTTILARWRWFGIVPDLTFAVVVCLAIFCGPETGAICGIAGGFLIEALGGHGVAVLPLIYLFLGYGIGCLTKTQSKRLTLYAIVGAATLPIHAMVTIFYTLINAHTLTGYTIGKVILPETAALVLLYGILYLPLRKLSERIRN